MLAAGHKLRDWGESAERGRGVEGSSLQLASEKKAALDFFE